MPRGVQKPVTSGRTGCFICKKKRPKISSVRVHRPDRAEGDEGTVHVCKSCFQDSHLTRE